MSDTTPTVFVVDDDVSVRESLELLIESAGWQCQTFASAEEFLSRGPVHARPSCLLLDVNLPDLSGLQVHESLIRDRFHMPVIFMSGHDAGDAATRATKTGSVAFLTKPLDADVLLRTIEIAVAGSGGGTRGLDGKV